MADNVETTLRIERGVYEQLAEAARQEGRSINQQAVYFIKAGLKTKEEGSKTA